MKVGRLSPLRVAGLALLVVLAVGIVQGAMGSSGLWAAAVLSACGVALFGASWAAIWRVTGRVGRWILATTLLAGVVAAGAILAMLVVDTSLDELGRTWIGVYAVVALGFAYMSGMFLAGLAWLAGSRRTGG